MNGDKLELQSFISSVPSFPTSNGLKLNSCCGYSGTILNWLTTEHKLFSWIMDGWAVPNHIFVHSPLDHHLTICSDLHILDLKTTKSFPNHQSLYPILLPAQKRIGVSTMGCKVFG